MDDNKKHYETFGGMKDACKEGISSGRGIESRVNGISSASGNKRVILEFLFVKNKYEWMYCKIFKEAHKKNYIKKETNNRIHWVLI